MTEEKRDAPIERRETPPPDKREERSYVPPKRPDPPAKPSPGETSNPETTSE